MSGEQLLEAVSYLTWAGGFAVLGVALGAAVLAYRRWVRASPHRDPHAT
jgi:hypothetical protein